MQKTESKGTYGKSHADGSPSVSWRSEAAAETGSTTVLPRSELPPIITALLDAPLPEKK